MGSPQKPSFREKRLNLGYCRRRRYGVLIQRKEGINEFTNKEKGTKVSLSSLKNVYPYCGIP